MHAEFQALIELPTAENFRHVRELVLAQPGYDPLGVELADLERLGRRRAWRKVRERAEAMLPRWLLSPRLHYWAAIAAEALDDEADAELERFLFGACLDALSSTGDGTREAPFLVTQLADIYDLLALRGFEPENQALVPLDEGFADVVTTKCGREIWFDVSDLLPRSPLSPELLLAEHSAGSFRKMPRFNRDFWTGRG